MSAFAVMYECANAPVDPGAFERMLQRMNHRGPDGRDIYLGNHYALGHWHFWTTPEEVGEKQPLQLTGIPFILVMDGRLDNRQELMLQLKIKPAEGCILSDAALTLHAYACWGEQCIEHFIGEYALVIIDERAGKLVCARNALGDRTLFYAFQGTCMLIASEPWAVAAGFHTKVDLNERAAAFYFDMQATEDGSTLFKDIFELPPAYAMRVSENGQVQWLTWQPDLFRKVRLGSEEEYAQEFRTLLEQSIQCRMRASTPVGVLMSGGLDSPSVACLAARMIAPTPLTTISYVFDELTDCDERLYIEAVKEQWGIRSIQIPCDDAWPFKNWQNWPPNPNMPEGNPYRLLKERAYQRAQTEGLRVLLTGGGGDPLYSAGKDWFADLVVDGHLLRAARELTRQIRSVGLRETLQADFLKRLARRILNHFQFGRRLHRHVLPPGWQTELLKEYLSKTINQNQDDPFIGQYGGLIGKRMATSISAEIFNTSRHSLELRHPYRDRRLVEFVLGLPAYQLFFRNQYKYILRNAMSGILPEIIRTRSQPTSMGPLYFRGFEREKLLLQAIVQVPQSSWSKFVNPEWLLHNWDLANIPEWKRQAAMVPWLSFSYDAWYKYITS